MTTTEIDDVGLRLMAEYPSVDLMVRVFRNTFATEANFLPQGDVTQSEIANSIEKLCKDLSLDSKLLFQNEDTDPANKIAEETGAQIKRIRTNEEFFDACARELRNSRTLRVTIVGPTFLEPEWWHVRSVTDNSSFLDFTEELKIKLNNPSDLQRCEIILRNNFERYRENLSEYVSGKTEWKKIIAEMRSSARKIFGLSGEKGPRIRCFDPGFIHLPHIFDDAVLIGTRATPLQKVNGGWKLGDSTQVAYEIEKWTSTFHTFPQSQGEALAILQKFLNDLEENYD